MKKIPARTWTFFFAGAALLALIFLAASLNNLKLADAEPVPIYSMMPNLGGSEAPDGLGRVLLAIFRVVVLLTWLLIPLYLILLVFSKEWRKRILRDLLSLLPIAIVLYLLSTAKETKQVAEEINPGMFNAGDLMPAGESAAPPTLPTFTNPPDWVTTAATIAIALLVILVFAGIFFVLWRRSQVKQAEPLRLVEREAQAAIDAIQAGGDVRDAIMRCYFQMIEALRQHRNLQRGADMTPHEFELLLMQRGMPKAPVHQLTQLFEQVRYGGLSAGRQEERAAVSSLSAIIDACQRTRA